ncbi:profilin, putative [Entamoeba dispar SAW760]|uniref:Profilin n=1 Tax=Entamoeba dispar (strain ATCC PRA-260 / SAW760) TaxID=370354 RepID=B0EFT9_ENTDS|nr:profilin, putative [Entamoeba dispar SAW760]EDR26605.1 profilin, putative [Entamoeba dispar SAW760]|eukprot:EDR26605.1 profilin, putative [Entamoeba dispar SAW760]
MSWQSYVDSFLVGAGKGMGGAIIGLQGGVWAASANCTPSAQESVTIGTACASNIAGLQQSGVVIGGKKFMITRVDADEGSAMGKKGAEGISIYKTKQAVIIGYFSDASVSAGQNSDATYKCAKYLMDAGY